MTSSCGLDLADSGKNLIVCSCQHGKGMPYFPVHKTHRDFFIRNFRKKNDECNL